MRLEAFLLTFGLISGAKPSETTFENVTIWKSAEEELAVIVSSNSLKQHLPNTSLDLIAITGEIPILYENSLSNISNVEQIYFHENELTEIKPGAFKNLTLEALEVFYSNLTTLKSGIFCNVSLEKLEISYNFLSKIEPFGGLTGLRVLSLSHNNLEDLEAHLLDKLPELQVLDLSYNRISVLHPKLLNNQCKLKTLLLRKNKFWHFPNIFENSSLELLELSSNLMSKLPEGVLDNLQNVSRLFLSFNHLESIPSNVFTGHPNIKELDLSNNRITTIASDAFDNMPQLVNIKFTSNKLAKYDPNWFHRTPNLYQLNLANNQIGDLPEEVFRNLYSDKKQWISLSGNKIKTISPNAFRGFKRFDTLNLSFNELESWDGSLLADTEVIFYLNLLHNKIKCVGGDLDQAFKANFTYLGMNPLAPRCLQKILDWRGDKHVVCTAPCLLY
ncbi:Leucine-rich repeat protein soc-2 homolog-like Protein [Tribolium castaneum]|uniref:Leucine-rich repeat protein soc-2 homolog-like Protein n=2 Tax=Tribolium castaneum TaxID=7070 RepID=D6WJG9_TRICA|nr:PREDICTED: carboxypeptidase N subunit 2 [Tribolium castaneum]EFA03896.2 Leucine-rich repeat protein soc-2 homolog-like Protein [Tribolium castaneum]|eukprot:XP_008193064.2 PREDICTED: carboxypeptidase N subunit 2 [Tribolium castaneum]